MLILRFKYSLAHLAPFRGCLVFSNRSATQLGNLLTPCSPCLVVAKRKERNPQMSQMTQMGAAPHEERKIRVCGHLRHLRMLPLPGAAFSILQWSIKNAREGPALFRSAHSPQGPI